MILEEISNVKDSKDPKIISQVLLKFYTTVDFSTFFEMKIDERKNHFLEIFEFLLNAVSNSTEANRLMAYRSCAFFCLKTLPYFLPAFIEAYIEILNREIVDKKEKSILASVFAFIVSFIPLHQSQVFIKRYEFETLFIDTDPSFSIVLPKIIEKLGPTGVEWHKNLLSSLLEFYKGSQERVFFKSVYSTLSLFPEQLTPLFLENTNDFTLVSFVFPVIKKYVDFSVLVPKILDELKKTDVTIPVMDSSLTILNECEGLVIKMFEKSVLFSYNSISEEIPLETLQKSSYIYLFELPFDTVALKSDDNGVVMQSKLTSIGKRIGKEPRAIKVFEEIISKPYDSNTTYALQALASCVEKLNFSNELAFLLQKIVFGKIENWYHATDVISILLNIKTEEFGKYFGKNGIRSIVNLMLKYISSSNEGLAQKSNNLITKITNDENVEEIACLVSSNIDYMDNRSIIASTNLLKELITTHSKRERIIEKLNDVVMILIEIKDWIKEDIDVLSSVLSFLAVFKASGQVRAVIFPVFIESVDLMTACYQFITGDVWSPTSHQNCYSESLIGYFSSKTIDITDVPSLESTFAPFVSAVDLILDFPANNIEYSFLVDILMKIYPLFPLKTIQYISDNLEFFKEQKEFLIKIVNNISNSAWNFGFCSIALLTDLYTEISEMYKDDQSLQPAYQFITASAKAFTKISSLIDDASVAKIALFLNDNSWIPEKRRKQIAENEEKHVEIEDKEEETSERVFEIRENCLTPLFNGEKESSYSCLINSLLYKDLYGVRVSLNSIENKKDVLIPFYVFPEAVPLLANATGNKMLISHSVCKESALLNKEEILEKIIKSERPKKKDVLVLIKFMNSLSYSTDSKIEAFKKIFSTADTPGRMRVTALLALIIATTTNSAKIDQLQMIFDDLMKIFPNIEDIIILKALCALTEKGCHGDFTVYNTTNPQIKTIQEKISVIHYPKTVPFLVSNSSKFILEALPSTHMCGLRLVSHIASFIPKENAVDVLQASLYSILKTLKMHTRHYCGGEYLASALSYLFLYPKFAEVFIKNLNILPLRNTAAFVEMSETFHLLFNEQSSGTEEFEKLCKMCDRLFSTPPCRKLFESYVLTLNARVNITNNKMLRETIVSDPLLYCLRKFSDYDSWWVENMLFEWLMMMEKTVGIVQTVTMLTIQFVKYVPRFYTVFVAGMMLMDETLPNISPEDKKKVEELMNDAKIIVKCRAHAAAFILLAQGKRMSEALDLAFASCDTEETDLIAKPVLEGKI